MEEITNHIIRQYQKIDSPPFNTGFSMLVVTCPSATQTKYGWFCVLLEWTNNTRHDLITRNLWPQPEITTSQELNTMPMHDKQWGTDVNSWKSQGTITKLKIWADSSTKLTTPRSISISATADRFNISDGPYLSTHVFTKVNIDAPNPTDNIWISTSHVFLPTFWCAKCDSWSSHHDKLHDERIQWQTRKNAQMAKKDEYQKQTQHNQYGPPQQQDRTYGINNSHKRSSTTYGRDNYQDKRSRNDRGRSPSRDSSNSQTRSPRSPGDNHQNGASFYEEKNKY
jgi:hypothetical protein